MKMEARNGLAHNCRVDDETRTVFDNELLQLFKIELLLSTSSTHILCYVVIHLDASPWPLRQCIWVRAETTTH